MPKLTLPDGATTELPEGEPVGSVLPPEAIAARVDGQAVDLSFVPSADAVARVRPSGANAALVVPRRGPAARVATARPVVASQT